MRHEKILVLDDELLMRQFLAHALQSKGYDVVMAEEGKKALAILKEFPCDILLTDMKLPTINGLEVIRLAKQMHPGLTIIAMTAHGSIENAVEAMRLGAFHYLLKPFSLEALETILEKAQEQISLRLENENLREEVKTSRISHPLVAESPAMKNILQQVQKIAASQASVFIQGESGTGKEVISSAIHSLSLRSQGPYVCVNCAAIPDTLIESEFFGHEKGAFTGAQARKLGKFELAHRGTLLLDEVTEIPLQLQPKLLRAIQEKEIERLGGTKPLSVDIRFVATSNRDMRQAIQEKIFREDLFYRLNVVPLHLPPLRDRQEDIHPLAESFLEKYCHENHKKKKVFTPDALQKLLKHAWPGNVRELANAIERVVVLDFDSRIAPEHLSLG